MSKAGRSKGAIEKSQARASKLSVGTSTERALLDDVYRRVNSILGIGRNTARSYSFFRGDHHASKSIPLDGGEIAAAIIASLPRLTFSGFGPLQVLSRGDNPRLSNLKVHGYELGSFGLYDPIPGLAIEDPMLLASSPSDDPAELEACFSLLDNMNAQLAAAEARLDDTLARLG